MKVPVDSCAATPLHGCLQYTYQGGTMKARPHTPDKRDVAEIP